MKGRRLIVHPWLIAAFPILAMHAHNSSDTTPADLLLPILVVEGIALVLWVLLSLGMRSALKGGIIVSLVVALFFSFEHWRSSIDAVVNRVRQDYWDGKIDFRISPVTLLVVEGVLIALATWYVSRRMKEPVRTTNRLNAFALVLVAMPLVLVGPGWVRLAMSKKGPGIIARRGQVAAVLAPTKERRPDIYYILMDGMAREDVMKEYFDLDVQPFLKHLEDRGFYVANKAPANYAQTPLCLSSSLNFRYLDDPQMGRPRDLADLKTLIGKNAVMESLRPLGYKFVTFATGFDPTDHPEADVYLSPHASLTEFQWMLLGITPIKQFLQNPHALHGYRLARERTQYLLDTLPKITEDREPTFTFAHVVCPHPPFVFGELGEDVSPYQKMFLWHDGNVFHHDATTPDEYVQGYRKQVIFITDRIAKTIDAILARSPEPPIILLQSDHGSGLRLNIHNLDKTDLHERMNILSSYYLPYGGRDRLYPSISPVNSFRVVLDATFGAKLPLLPDRSYFSTWGDPLNFFDVTKAIPDGPPKGAWNYEAYPSEPLYPAAHPTAK